MTWPKAGTAEVTPAKAATRVADLPVWVTSDAGGPQRVGVEVLDRAQTHRAGVDGVLFRVKRADGRHESAPVTVDVD